MLLSRLLSWKRRGWLVSDLRPGTYEVHVVPVNDEIVHDMTEDCECRPRVEMVEGSSPDVWLVVHDAADGRA